MYLIKIFKKGVHVITHRYKDEQERSNDAVRVAKSAKTIYDADEWEFGKDEGKQHK